MVKESRFNLFYDVEEESKFLAYNSRTGALALMKKDDYHVFQNMKNKNFTQLSEAEEKLINDMKEGGYLIDDSIDELQLIKYEQNRAKFNSRSLGLTIAPTLGCNFRCVYCYQKDHEDYSKMSKITQDHLLSFISREINNINSLSITWYGGEPLLALDVIENLSLKLIELCKQNNVAYSATLVTNGYLLNKKIVETLKKSNIEFMQVTLDGCEETHNEKRFLVGNQPTFRKILENLSEIINDFRNISLRVNTDKKNKDEVFKIFDILKEYELYGKIIPYLAYVEPINNTYDESNCLSIEEFTKISNNFQDEARKAIVNSNIMSRYPSARLNYCGADLCNSYVIDPNGNLYKCWSDIGRDEYCVGDLEHGVTKYKQILKYSMYDVINDKECTDCKILPLCAGGCPRRRVDGIVDRCSELKVNLESYLRKVMEFRKNNKTNEGCQTNIFESCI